jgi:hypothetical protein
MKAKSLNPFSRVAMHGITLAIFMAASFSSLAGEKKPDSLHVNLDEIILQASFVRNTRSPLRITTVDNKEIEKKAIGFTYPELAGNMPGVYATSESGSYGDARINIRGFKQENISVLLNGIPISGLVTGNMFWNNWLGLSDATHSIQVQKGIGASMLSDNSVGGTINIITKTTRKKAGGTTGIYITDYGEYKGFASYNTGQLKGGWSVAAMASYAGGNGYPNSTDINSWAYMLNISKKINDKHSLLLTALGSPERHRQRSSRLTFEEIRQYGLKYNKNYGYHDGKERNLSENFYHKPYLTLHHFYKPSGTAELSTSLYLSSGNGGGKWHESKGKRIPTFTKEGLIDWNAVEEYNGESAENIVTDYLAGHIQTGLKSNLRIDATEKWTLNTGVHYQYYSTWEKEQITDLLGSEYWYEDYENNSLAGLAGRDPVKREGDFVRTYNGKLINHLTLYGSADYSGEEWELRIGASLMGSTNRRWDRYNYTTDVLSDVATAGGYSLKGGAARKMGMRLTAFLNGGIYSRIPYSDIFFSSGNNNITDNVKNEKNIISEAGLRYLFQRGSVEITAYYALWKNKSIMSDPYKQQDNTNHRYLIRGLNALHTGIEITGVINPSRHISLSGYLSIGDWKWKNNVSANIYDPYSGILTDIIEVYSNNLPVGDAPQTQIAAEATATPHKNLQIRAEWRYNARMYADFDPTDRQDPQDLSHPYRTPSYSLANASVTWHKGATTIFARVNNLLNTSYIMRGKDGPGHDMDTFSGFWGAGRNSSIGVRFNF